MVKLPNWLPGLPYEKGCLATATGLAHDSDVLRMEDLPRMLRLVRL